MGYIFICILVLIVLKQLHIISMPLNKDIHSRHRKQNGTNSMHIYFITNFYAPFHLENALSNIEKVFLHSIYHRLHLFTKILNYVDRKYFNSVWCISLFRVISWFILIVAYSKESFWNCELTLQYLSQNCKARLVAKP